ncbi:MAG: hypothetical protein K2O45_07005 [Oscillospiraceae bacterium]|nr:hypothetical protein [Oscillospiraceae bacterium]
MGTEYNYVGYNYGGIVGGSYNTVNNILQTDTGFFSNGTDRGKGNEFVHFTLLLGDDSCDACRNAVVERFDTAFAVKRYPLWVEITDLVDICARIVYFNGGPNDEDVEKLINRFFTAICLPFGFEYQAKIVRVGSGYFFEMYPQE